MSEQINLPKCGACGRTETTDLWWPFTGADDALCQDCWEDWVDKTWWENLTGDGPMIVIDIENDCDQ